MLLTVLWPASASDPQLRHARVQELACRGDPRLVFGNGREHRGTFAESRPGIHHRFVSRQLHQCVDRGAAEA